MAKKKLEGGKGLFHLTLPGPRASLREGGAGAKGEQLDAGTEAELGHGREMLLTGLLSLACSACFLQQPKTTCPGPQ